MDKSLNNIKCFLLDMDGTFYLGDTIIDGSLNFIDNLNKTGKDYFFLTNNSSHNASFYQKRLEKMGLNIDKNKIITSGKATAYYVNSYYKNKSAFVLGNDFLKEELTQHDVNVVEKNPDFLIIGFDTTLTYEKLTKVYEYIVGGLDFIATHPDNLCPTATGFIPDIGAILSFIKTATEKDPKIIIGKPNYHIFDYATKITGYKKENLAMVGDRLYTDIKSGIINNILSILVLSGETDKDMLAKSNIRPDFVFNNLGEIYG